MYSQPTWEMFKVKVKKGFIIFSRAMTHQKITSTNKLSKELDKWENSHKTKVAIIRSRVKWFEEGEKNTKYFMGGSCKI